MLLLLAVILDASAAARAMQLGRRDTLRKGLETFSALDTDGDWRLEKDELRGAVGQLCGRSMTEEEFDALFDQVDEDGSGTVGIHDFLACEDMFWGDAGGAAEPRFRRDRDECPAHYAAPDAPPVECGGAESPLSAPARPQIVVQCTPVESPLSAAQAPLSAMQAPLQLGTPALGASLKLRSPVASDAQSSVCGTFGQGSTSGRKPGAKTSRR
eukprot:gene20753-13175_t